MENNSLSIPVASIISYASKKIMSLRQVAYKYGVVEQKTTTAYVRSQKASSCYKSHGWREKIAEYS